MTADVLINEELLTLDYWQSRVPSLSLSKVLERAPTRFAFPEPDVNVYLKNLRTEAYFITPPVLETPLRERLLSGIDQLISCQIEPTWALMFDEFWELYAAFGILLDRVFGEEHKLVTGNYVFVIPNVDTAEGWRAHRDLMFRPSLSADGMPKIMTFWVALTDATPLNSCLYCLPASRDPNYPNNLSERSVPHIEDIECMPVKAGQVIGLNHALLHWGGRSSSRGANRRVSFVFDVQRGDVPGFHEALIDPKMPLSFEQRAAYIGHVILWLRRYNVVFREWDIALAREMVKAYGKTIGLRAGFLDDYS